MVEPSHGSRRPGPLTPRERWLIVSNRGAVGYGRARFLIATTRSEIIGRDDLAPVVGEQGTKRIRLDRVVEKMHGAIGEGRVGPLGSPAAMSAEDAGRGDLRIGEDFPIVGLGPGDGPL